MKVDWAESASPNAIVKMAKLLLTDAEAGVQIQTPSLLYMSF